MTAEIHPYAREIRDYLLGRLEAQHQDDAIRRGHHPELPRRWLNWWLFEGKRYDGLAAPLGHSWADVARQVERMRAAHAPRRRVVMAPEGEVDWLGSALISLTSGTRQYVARASGLGLDDPERAALDGWVAWITARWRLYMKDVGPLPDVDPALPESLRNDGMTRPAGDDALQKWAHAARRSRWPLLRNVVAESLRTMLERQEIDRLPLPSEHSTLFELVCLVRVLHALHPADRCVRWLDGHDGNNTLNLPGLVCRYQPSFTKEDMLSSGAFNPALVVALRRHGVAMAGRLDVWFAFDPPRAGFVGLLLECKSGGQDYSAAVDQLHRYRAVWSKAVPGRVLALAVVEKSSTPDQLALTELRSEAEQGVNDDVYAFCSNSNIAEVLRAVGILA